MRNQTHSERLVTVFIFVLELMILCSATTLECTRHQLDRCGNYLSVICQSEGQPSDFSVTVKKISVDGVTFPVNATSACYETF